MTKSYFRDYLCYNRENIRGESMMLKQYPIFFKSILWIIGITFLFLLRQGFSALQFTNTLFLVSLFFFCIYAFKWILDQGTFYTFQYSWQKTKRYVLFFLPKYWTTKDVKDKKNDYDEATREKIFHSFEEFYEYKQSKRWLDINQLLSSTLILLALSFILSFAIL